VPEYQWVKPSIGLEKDVRFKYTRNLHSEPNFTSFSSYYFLFLEFDLANLSFDGLNTDIFGQGFLKTNKNILLLSRKELKLNMFRYF
jgi:hypothetical protein